MSHKHDMSLADFDNAFSSLSAREQKTLVRGTTLERMGCGSRCLRMFLMVWTGIVCVICLVCVIRGLMFLDNSVGYIIGQVLAPDLISALGNNFGILLAGLGALGFLFSFFGLYGVKIQSRNTLLYYLVWTALITLAMLAISGLMFSHWGNDTKDVKQVWNNSDNKQLKLFQQDYKCCGWNGNNGTLFGDPCPSGLTVVSSPCEDDMVQDYEMGFMESGILLVGSAVLSLLGFMFSICMYRSIDPDTAFHSL